MQLERSAIGGWKSGGGGREGLRINNENLIFLEFCTHDSPSRDLSVP